MLQIRYDLQHIVERPYPVHRDTYEHHEYYRYPYRYQQPSRHRVAHTLQHLPVFFRNLDRDCDVLDYIPFFDLNV